MSAPCCRGWHPERGPCRGRLPRCPRSTVPRRPQGLPPWMQPPAAAARARCSASAPTRPPPCSRSCRPPALPAGAATACRHRPNSRRARLPARAAPARRLHLRAGAPELGPAARGPGTGPACLTGSRPRQDSRPDQPPTLGGDVRNVTTDLEAAVRAALAKVIDPELRRPITELGMVKSVDVGPTAACTSRST